MIFIKISYLFDYLIPAQITYSCCALRGVQHGREQAHFSIRGVILEKRGEGLTRERARPIDLRPSSEEI
jgi:hypothetical protein